MGTITNIALHKLSIYETNCRNRKGSQRYFVDKYMYISLHNSVRDDTCRQAAYILPLILEMFRSIKYILQVCILQWAYVYIGVQSKINNLAKNVFLPKYITLAARMLHSHDDVIKWKHCPRYWLFVRGIHRSLVNSPHKGKWRGT